MKQKVKEGVANSFIVEESVPNSLYEFTSHTFTTCGMTGQSGPVISQCRSAYNTDWDEDNSKFKMTRDGTQEWIVPATGNYKITAIGAAGGRNIGGLGAKMEGTFSLTEGEFIQILVGQKSNSSAYSGEYTHAGGGGGSFVVKADNTPLIIAGGGGGAYNGQNNATITDASITEQTKASSTNCPGSTGGSGGPICGYTNSRSCAGQGGGFYTNAGATDCGSITGNNVAYGFLNGGKGGIGSCGRQPYGGFGGGGGTGCGGAGAGGGYTGGSGSYANGQGSGGGSFNSGSNPINTAGFNSGEGSVTIEKL